MRKLLSLSMVALSALWVSDALPCGGGFSPTVVLQPDQRIVVVHKNGTEQYIFNPSFCGKAGSFGLILPVPQAPSADPALLDSKLFTELDTYTAPQTVEDEVCKEDEESGGCFGSKAVDGATAAPNGRSESPPSVTVISTGQVGIFEYSILKADTSKAFTDWLTANGYPYDAKAQEAFEFYVTAQSYFVAFKVDTPSGSGEICGNFGPISLSFPSDQAYIPVRIAADTVKSSMRWRVFVVGQNQVVIPDTSEPTSNTIKFSFSGAFQGAATYPGLASIASEGDWVTAGDLNISPSTNLAKGDVRLDVLSTKTPSRVVIHKKVYVDCDSCRIAGPRGKHIRVRYLPTIALLCIGLLIARRRRRSQH